METLSGSVERITSYIPEYGTTVLRLRPEHLLYPGSVFRQQSTHQT